MQRIRKGDEVIVICGRDKGTKGTVLSRVDDRHVLVEGVNVVKKHVRPNPALGVAGGIVDKTMPIDQSNVMLVNPEQEVRLQVHYGSSAYHQDHAEHGRW